MTFKLKSGEKLPRGMRRVARKQMDEVLALLARHSADRGNGSVHSARKGLKKLRSEFRLLRHAVSEDFYEHQAGGFREASRALAQSRDAEVLLKTLQKLCNNGHGPQNGDSFPHLNKILSQRHQESLTGQHVANQQCKARLTEATRHLDEWPLHKLRWDDLCLGIQRSYKRGRNALAAAKKRPAAPALHEWRKRVKDLWYQARVLQRVKSRAMAGVARDAKKLSTLLGDDHDLAMLESTARSVGLNREERALVSAHVTERRAKLQKEAFKLGRRVYRQRPAAFGRRIARYAKHWRD